MSEQRKERTPKFYLFKDLSDDGKNSRIAIYASNDTFFSNKSTILHFEVDSNGTLTISGDIDVIKSIRAYVSYAEKVLERPIKKIIIESTRPLEIEDYFISDCDSLESVVISCPQNVKIYRGTFVRCHNLKEIIITSLSKEFNIDISEEKYPDDRKPYLKNVEIIIDSLSSIKLDELIRFNSIKVSNATSTNLINYENKNNSYNYENMKNIFIDNLVIDDLSEEGINKLKEIVKNYSLDNIKKITIGDFEIKKELFNSKLINMPPKEICTKIFENITFAKIFEENIFENIKIQELSWWTRSILKHYVYDAEDATHINLLNEYKPETLMNNFVFFKNILFPDGDYNFARLSIIKEVFQMSPQLLNVDFAHALENIENLRKESLITDEDIKTCYFNDTNLEIDLSSDASIKNYIKKYIEKYRKLPVALNSLLFENDNNKVIDIVDRITYVTTMNLTDEERDAYLYKDGIKIIQDVDNKSFSSIYNDQGEKANLINEKMPFFDGIKTVVYKKMKGYINQNDNKNILFDLLVDPIIKDYDDSRKDTTIVSFLKKRYYDLHPNNKENLTRMKNIVCGKVLYELLSHIKYLCDRDVISYSENNVRDILAKNSFKDFSYNQHHLFDESPVVIEMMLKIDPYSFDLLRNESSHKDSFIRQPMKEFEKLSNIVFPLDARYYYIAKASGYRFTADEDKYYKTKIAEFNKKLKEAINNPQYAEFKTDLEKYIIKPINTKPDIMKVFYEYLQNEIVPTNIPLSKQHDFEEKVKVLVDKFIEGESKEGTTLSKIIYSVDMLYRNNNPAILYKSNEEILENPKLISNPKINDIEKLGVALIALNKMAHEQIDDFIPSEFVTRFRYNTPNVMAENTNFAKGIIDALTILSNYTDLEWFYKSQFKDLNNSELIEDTDFFRYIDNKYQEYYIANLDEDTAKNIFAYVRDNSEEFKKISNNENIEDVSSKIKKYYNDNKIYVDYIIEKGIDKKSNPLLLDKSKYKSEFEKWKKFYMDHYGTVTRDSLEKDKKELDDMDYFKIFRSMQKVREGIKNNHDVVKHVLDNALSQKNMYDLKQKFTEILLQKTISELSNNSMESNEILETIATMTKEDKMKMFNNTGMIMEIHEDDYNERQSVLVLYSKNINESYSIHLQENYINDENREINRANRVVVNSQLDDKNLTFNNTKHCYNFTGKHINFNNTFMKNDLGRSNAILLNFINIEIPALLNKYGITKDLMHKVINKEIMITSENLNYYLDNESLTKLRNAGISDEIIAKTVNSIINGINTMAENLKSKKGKKATNKDEKLKNAPEKTAKNVLKIPEDMELDDEFSHLRNLSFININSADIPTIRYMLNEKAITYDSDNIDDEAGLNRLFEEYNKILESKHKNYLDALNNEKLEKHSKVFVVKNSMLQQLKKVFGQDSKKLGNPKIRESLRLLDFPKILPNKSAEYLNEYHKYLKEIMKDLTTYTRESSDNKKYFQVGNDYTTFEITANQADNRLKRLYINIDFNNIDDKELIEMLEKYITRIVISKLNNYKGNENDLIDIINMSSDLCDGKLDGKCIDKKCRTKINSINEELKNKFILICSKLLQQSVTKNLIDSMYKKALTKPNDERAAAIEELKVMITKLKKITDATKNILNVHGISDIEKEKMAIESLEESIEDKEIITKK